VRDNEPLPIWARWWLLGVLPLAIAIGATLIVMFVPSLFPGGRVSPAGLMIVLPAFLLANTVLAILRCVDWFEARKKKRGANNG
jgi:hypothetical protein